MNWKVLLKDDKGLGDTIARTTDYVGIKKFGGCAKRQKKLNRLVKYKGVPNSALTCREIGCNRASVMYCNHCKEGLCGLHAKAEMSLENWNDRGIHQWRPIDE